MSITYLGQQSAQALDVELMSQKYGYTLEQLMELAGLACAQALESAYPYHTHHRVLVCCGPGNQGGDGLVAARHLVHFGYRPIIYYPKQANKEFYRRLLQQCETLGIQSFGSEKDLEESLKETAFEKALNESDVVLDAIFGFSFKGEPKPPFAHVISQLRKLESRKPIVSVDIPSGWDVEIGDPHQRFFKPDVLISLTMPKLGSKDFKGRHILGGRFVPPVLAEKYGLIIPTYPGSAQIVDITQTDVVEKL
ncbi:hypothetical protein CROQUDRAFT_655079 [Cronartium quercuum f. sp. fusiforme G11]|uniref:NAD(P)H-hydrate epimerase n=1 Tax=Cronartium quercuum f. sp. fusiforme G11 TaxID=708437 RepID=A0A9P6NRF0_9BASI|nr:hypothetical protein CROQUDRAFT_655079 [Cronartium quercuum f. sp. fusiforme G11]